MAAKIRIVAVPPGEAPLWVREKWVGLELPLAREGTRPVKAIVSGVLTGPIPFPRLLRLLWASLTGHSQLRKGYAVEIHAAIEILQAASPEAAEWWRRNTPRLFSGNRKLLFQENVCRIVSPATPPSST